MGRQIQIAQSPEDEARINEILVAKYDVVSVPWWFDSRKITAKCPGEQDFYRLMLFGRRFARLMTDQIYKNVDGKEVFYRVDPCIGIFVEWHRTEHVKRNGHVAGRYYLDSTSMNEAGRRRGKLWQEAVAHTKSVMSFILRHVQKTYPKKSDGRYPIFVGPDLVERIRSGGGVFYQWSQEKPVKLFRT